MWHPMLWAGDKVRIRLDSILDVFPNPNDSAIPTLQSNSLSNPLSTHGMERSLWDFISAGGNFQK